MLNKDTLQILQSITGITNSAIISYPQTVIQNYNKDVIGIIDFSQKEDEGWDEFGIFDLSNFLGALSVLDNPTIELKENSIIAKDSDSEIQFVTSYPSALQDFTTTPSKVTTTLQADSVLEVEINTDTINRIRKGANVFKTLKDLFLVKEGNEFFIRTGNKKKFNSKENSYSIKLEPELSRGDDFEIAIPIDNFLSLPLINFNLSIKEKNGQYRVTLTNNIFKFILSTVI